MTSNQDDLDAPAVLAYGDGACRGNPGPGGYGVVLISGTHRRTLSGGYRRTTNNRMEIMAAIKTLEALKRRCRVTFRTDSQYLAKAIGEGWAVKWRAKGWWISANKRAKNSDLWQELVTLIEQHSVTVEWLRGHNNDADNDAADRLAVEASMRPDLQPDAGFEALLANPEPPAISEGHPCFKCRTPVVKQQTSRKVKPGQQYYYEWILRCPQCGAIYTIEGAKRLVGERNPELPL
ncbi:MAG: ribonuclease HI [Kiritimatiellae bacterium]|nr:ribonuclease HI [Kiritimatiellia bacterium]